MRLTLMRGMLGLLPLVCLTLMAAHGEDTTKTAASGDEAKMEKSSKTELATFGQGCFWCAEAIYQRVPGVSKVESGYSNGTMENPTYEDVCSGASGHAEVIQVTFDPTKVTYEHLLDTFFKTHDPTTLNRQGNDRGTQYRSAIFYHSDEQKKAAEAAKEKWNKSGHFKDPIVTEIAKADKFYKAEDYHQNYFNTHPKQPYCQYVIAPKVEKFEKAKDE